MSKDATLVYCCKCRKKQKMADITSVTMKNGRPAARGKCDVCSTAVFKILPTSAK